MNINGKEIDVDITKINYLLKVVNDMLDEIKNNDGDLRWNCGVSFYNNTTDAYNELMKIKRSMKE